jgi:hypothetical protein
MKLRYWMKNLAGPLLFKRSQSNFATIYCGQNIPDNLDSPEPYMPSLSARCAVLCFCLGLFLGSSTASHAQTNYYASYGTEFPIIGSLPGDQVYPDVALNKNGGYIVWQDNITDPVGLGISARQLDDTLSGVGATFAVNATATNDQENARVTLLNNGGAAFVWQGGPANLQHIYARFLSAGNQWLSTTNVRVSAFAGNSQESPAIATLTNGNVIVVWDSFDQAGPSSFDDVYGQMFSAGGTPIGTNFLINIFTTYNQRNPAVSALNNGGFVVAWVSEQQRLIGATNADQLPVTQMATPSVDIDERIYTNSGSITGPSTGEILVNEDNNPCARPAIATASDGSYMVTWCADTLASASIGWDIYARSFTNSTGGPVIPVNSYTAGDQYNPRISVIGQDYMIVWTSLGQDSSREGVFGQSLHENGFMIGSEFGVNTTTLGQQMQPAVASDGGEQFLAVWTSFTLTPNGFDLYAQRYLNVGAALAPMAAPYVWAPFEVDSNGNYQPELVVTWAPVQGLTVSNYEVFVNSSPAPMATVTGNSWTMTAANGLGFQETNTFQVAYMTTAGYLSPLSPTATGETWEDCNWYGVPCQWMTEYFGHNLASWPVATARVNPGGPTLLQIFMTGGNPTNSATWLQTTMTTSNHGMYLNWNTQPGMTYQIQATTDFKTWNNYGSPIFERGTNDTRSVGNGGGGYYRVELLQP